MSPDKKGEYPSNFETGFLPENKENLFPFTSLLR